MNELKMRCMESNPSNAPLRSLRRVVLSVADDRVADRRKLHSDLILQSRHQFHSDERSIREEAFDGISKFGTSRSRIALPAQLLKHSFSSKVVNERPFLDVEMAANYRKILPHRSVAEKLSNQRISIRLGLRKQQNPGRKTIDAMHDQGSLSLRFEVAARRDKADGVSEP